MILWTRVKVLTRETILNPIKTETNDKKWIEETMNKINGYLLILTKAWLLHSFYNHDYASKLLRQLNLQFLKFLLFVVVMVVISIGRISFYIYISLSGHVTLFLVPLFLRLLQFQIGKFPNMSMISQKRLAWNELTTF